eukprot:CAMPEP_0176354252 /NCGR_PEP_ID=MMETSP0126-20121128/12414_1 /TAXON_ID=141414 ORGANISM="Strombidinopsis acuminatum, Strain SPMC142" /NCGR_SAMPLE_ID=MMETSP0126 /ASSEMBLY_ACC=CAM_ASM_000229 /LENGTH=74 /DNA_ID=CAMNT_0017706327 /DNA_START=690 /DNA_END=914 /DNA_ORIENTATION=+
MGCGMSMLAIAFCFFEGKNCFRFFWNKMTGKKKKVILDEEGEEQEYDPEVNQGEYGEERGDTNEDDEDYADDSR